MRLINFCIVILLASACASSGDNFKMSGEVIQIQFTDNIKEGDWFKLDELEFNHILYDTTKFVDQPNFNDLSPFDNPTDEYVERGFLPVSRNPNNAAGTSQAERIQAGRIAGLFVQRLYQKQANLQDGDLIYQVGRAEYLILGGKVFVKRNDDKPIKVSANTNGGIYFDVLSKENKIYKQLFEKSL